jgi:hypothetical protein
MDDSASSVLDHARMRSATSTSERAAVATAALLAALVGGLTVNRSVFAPEFSDSAGYVTAGEAWRTATLVRPVSLRLWHHWESVPLSQSPLGWRPGIEAGTDVPMYAQGYPLLIAAAVSATGAIGAYLVAPAAAGLLVWCAFVIARRLAGSGAALLAAGLVALDPVMLSHAVHAMSDVPAAACWLAAVALVMAPGRTRAFAAGLLCALAIMIRPNLAPLALAPAIVVIGETDPGRRQRLIALVAGVIPGPVLVAWSQAVLYGHPLQPGYPGWETFFQRAHIAANLATYPRRYLDVHGWVPLLAAIAAVAVAARRGPANAATPLALAALVVANVAVFVAYLPYEHWLFLRFFLPATTALSVLAAAGVAWMMHSLGPLPQRRRLALLVPLAFVAAGTWRLDLVRFTLDEWRTQPRIQQMGHYLREVLPANAVALSYLHSGALAHYTGVEVVRLDAIVAAELDRIVADLEAFGRTPVLVLDDTIEAAGFRERFAASRYGALDWPPRARFVSDMTISYFLLGDRERSLAGARWPVDVVRCNSTEGSAC